MMIDQISKELNFSIVHKRSPIGTGHGIIYENGTATGNLALTIKNEVNLTFGVYMVTKERATFLEIGDLFIQVKMVFAFKERDTLIKSIARFTAPFGCFVWLLIFGVLSFAVVIILLTKKLSRKWRHFYIGGRQNRSPIQNMWATVLGNPIANRYIASGRSFGTFARTLLLLWILLWLIIRNAYQGALYYHLQGQTFSSPYDSVEKIEASNCKIFAIPSIIPLLKNFFKSERYNETNLSEEIK